ncbi:MAG TPA: PRC-barrel domain-containing protein [Pseudolabrys sp.]|jgi:sporulation protein YlmC with PRC-barrel domain|nr:PRC-barrel domain-containing protein [Pseudolabrys sp.]
MLNKLMLGVALSALAFSGAMAQSSPAPSPSSPSATPPAASSPSSPDTGKSSTSGAATTSSPSAASTAGASSAKFISTQSPDQFLASKFKGTDVVGSDDKKIGDVSDVLFDKDGKIEAYVVSVGGFLGVGAKDVALAPTAFEVVKGTNGSSDKLKLSMSKDELKQAQNFEPYKAPASTTGAGTRPGGMSPAGGGMKPASPSK